MTENILCWTKKKFNLIVMYIYVFQQNCQYSETILQLKQNRYPILFFTKRNVYFISYFLKYRKKYQRIKNTFHAKSTKNNNWKNLFTVFSRIV